MSSGAAPGTTFFSNVSDLLFVAGKLGYAQDRWVAYAKAGYAISIYARQRAA